MEKTFENGYLTLGQCLTLSAMSGIDAATNETSRIEAADRAIAKMAELPAEEQQQLWRAEVREFLSRPR